MRLLILVLGGLFALTVFLFLQNWSRLDWHMSIHGWIAMVAGVVISLLLGGGLMALSFYSSRHGYDDRVPRDEPPGDEDEEQRR